MNMTIAHPWFDHVQDNRKNIEGRLFKGKFTHLKAGDAIVIHNPENTATIDKTITSIDMFSSFQHALEQIPVKDVLPGITSMEEGVKIYNSIYSKEDQSKYRVCMLKWK